jgi:hypothetical protein
MSILVDVASAKSGIEAFDLLSKELDKKTYYTANIPIIGEVIADDNGSPIKFKSRSEVEKFISDRGINAGVRGQAPKYRGDDYIYYASTSKQNRIKKDTEIEKPIESLIEKHNPDTSKNIKILYPESLHPSAGQFVDIGSRKYKINKVSYGRRISEDDPSIEGSHLLGYEGDIGVYIDVQEVTEPEYQQYISDSQAKLKEIIDRNALENTPEKIAERNKLADVSRSDAKQKLRDALKDNLSKKYGENFEQKLNNAISFVFGDSKYPPNIDYLLNRNDMITRLDSENPEKYLKQVIGSNWDKVLQLLKQ